MMLPFHEAAKEHHALKPLLSVSVVQVITPALVILDSYRDLLGCDSLHPEIDLNSST